MSRVGGWLRHPFWQAILLLILAYLLFKFGIAFLPPLLGMTSAPVPSSVVVQYMLIALVGVLIHVSSDETRWRRFKEPIHGAMVDADKRWVRLAVLILVPLLVGWVTYDQTRPKVEAPITLRSIHPAPPNQITFRGKTIQLTGLENPLRHRGSLTEHIETGKRIYYQNCLACHGDRLDGQGHFAHGFSPTPLSFADQGTIAQLTESFVFWRIAKGGPGLPREGAPWSSAMPVWEDYLTEDEIWAVIIYLYEQSGWKPRTWEQGGTPTGRAEGAAHE
ncbi:MAG: cytochrome c [Gemmatimonadota bacterium]|nr:cytochrome c [Gemmatimonadota bacterium]